MCSWRRSEWHGWRPLGIVILILSTIRVPLPQADYHNIRHHDAAGEICVYHDHLLRWHPQANSNDDVSLLHWHWFLPRVAPDAQAPGGDDESRSPHSGPALHAHLGDWAEPDWTGTPVIRPDHRGRLIDLLALGLSGTDSGPASTLVTTDDPRTGVFSAGPPGGVVGLRWAHLSLPALELLIRTDRGSFVRRRASVGRSRLARIFRDVGRGPVIPRCGMSRPS